MPTSCIARQEHEVLHVEDARGFVGALELAPEADEVPRLVVRHRRIGHPLKEVATEPDLAKHVEQELGLRNRALGLNLQVHAVDLRPHFRRDRLAHRPRVLPAQAEARRNGVRVRVVVREVLDDPGLRGGVLAVARLERLLVATGIDERLPLMRGRERQVDL